MFPSFRRSFYKKFILFSVVITCFIVFYKVTISSLDNNQIDYLEYHITRNRKINKNPIDDDFNINNMQSENEKLIENYNALNDIYELIIRAELAKQVIGLGDGGVAIALSGEAKKRGEAKLSEIALNEELSEQISYNRTLSDSRNPLCKSRKYNLNNLPTTSVIIIYYNEPYSVILRTVHSVLRTTNARILKEVILVDDFSSNIELKGKLNYYVETRLPKNVKIITLKERKGLIRARLAGARLATGDILVFLDAHCECNIEWLEPLADRIKESSTSVLVPIIDTIYADNFKYSTNGYQIFEIGGFNWNGHYIWINIPEFEKERIKRECNYEPEICPTNTPTMAGGLLAINRKYFWEIGSYDDQMDGWGGENLEMSFRIWQCGGTIETIPCSRIGHIFKKFKHFNLPKDKDTHGINTVRMAKVWMDEYIGIFYMNRPELKNNKDVGDVTHRIMIRKKLKCKNFSWFLKNVYPQKFIPTKNVRGYGHFRSENVCLDDLQQKEPYILGVHGCNQKVGKTQFFSLSNDGILRTENYCAVIAKTLSKMEYNIAMVSCKNNKPEFWSYSQDGHLMHLKSRLCLDSYGLMFGDHVQLKSCNRQSETQKWLIEH